MNKWEKEVQQSLLDSEEAAIKELEKQYARALKDINDKVKSFQADIDLLDQALSQDGLDDATKALLQSQKRSKVYQQNYQKALKGQVSGVLDKLHGDNYATIDKYLKSCYETGYIGTMYDIAKQGVPIIAPIDQAAAVKAILTDSKIVEGYYNHLGVNYDKLKKTITQEISRGIASGLPYSDIARNINNVSSSGLYNAKRIARTEGHRIQQTSSRDAQYAAKKKGCDVVKQWDASLDGRTRDSHARVDGEIRELDEKFSNGLMFPGDPSGSAAEVINCRCTSNTRARWALDDGELQTLKERAEYFGLDKTANFEDYTKKYLTASEIQAEVEQAAKPKKEYLTEKKLKQKIDDADNEIADLLAPYGGDEVKFTLGASVDDQAKYLTLLDSKNDWQKKLDKKLVTKEKKKLVKEQMQLQQQLDDIEIKTYSGIWKDDITTADYAKKQHSISAKKAYYENKLLTTADPDAIKKYQQYLKQLEEFETEGKKLYDLQTQLAATTAKLTNLQKSGIMSSGKAMASDAFSPERKQAAKWFDRKSVGFSSADAYFDPPAKAVHNAATGKEHRGFYTYTSGSGGHNRPLAGFEKPWVNSGTGWEQQYYKGPHKVWIDFEGKGEDIRGLTTLIEKSTYPDDVWLQSGQGFGTLGGFLGVDANLLQGMTDAELQQFVGKSSILHQFISTAVNEGGGSIFNAKPVKFNIYAPKGSEMLYASDVGAFGKGENEMILQRGGTYEIARIYWGKDVTDGNKTKLFVDLDLHPELGYDKFQQDPAEWKGSTKNYKS